VFKKIEYPKPEKIDKGDEIDAMSDEELELYQDNIKYYAEKLEISEKEVKYLVGRNLLNIKI
jgi:PDZ domain-containing secreted protein